MARNKTVFAALAALLLGAAMLSLCVGAVPVSPGEILSALFCGERETVGARIVLYTRLPRTAAALLAGSALAVAGAVIQTVLCNPLAAPNIIGVNASAGLAVTIACALTPMSAVSTPLIAFAGALAGVLLVLSLSELAGASRMTTVLAGVAVSNLLGAAIDAVVTLVPDALSGYSDFRIGGFSGVTMAQLAPAAVMILLGIVLALSLSRQIDVLALGAQTAMRLGLSVRPAPDGRVRAGRRGAGHGLRHARAGELRAVRAAGGRGAVVRGRAVLPVAAAQKEGRARE